MNKFRRDYFIAIVFLLKASLLFNFIAIQTDFKKLQECNIAPY